MWMKRKSRKIKKRKMLSTFPPVQELVGAGEPFEVVFVSSDKSAEELMAYMKVILDVEVYGDRPSDRMDCIVNESGTQLATV